MNYIRENLAVCGYHEIGSRERFQSHGFHAQLQCAGSFDAWLANVVEVKAAPFDDGMPIPQPLFRDAQAWLDAHWDKGHKILISCAAGKSRSITMAIALLYRKSKGSFRDAVREVLSRIPDAYPHPHVLMSASKYCAAPLSSAELRGIYSEVKVQPPYPWADELLQEAVAQSQ
jgi:hypothetical protein